jgi:ribosomal protein S18 acetylase RimI-like enzyme
MTTISTANDAPAAATPAPITRATAAAAERVVALIALAFGADPAMRWAFPEPWQYLTYGPAFVRAFGGRAFENGTADVAADGVGAALWLPPGVHPDDDALGAVVEASLDEPDRSELFAVFEEMGRFHPGEPHWYLSLIGVDPPRQGQGYGAALLRHGLARCDRDRAVAYLESTNPRNNPLYERHGFRVVGRIQRRGTPPIWPMVRLPR